MEINKIICGDTLIELKKLPNECIDLIITSPPYWGLRDYGVEGQIGLESTFDEFLKKILDITKELKRVLKKSGQFWLNFGDCYGGLPAGNKSVSKANIGKDSLYVRKMKCSGAKSFVYAIDNERMFSGKRNNSRLKQTAGEKCMLMQPERLAIKMIDEQGWILRNKIKWAKQVLLYKERKTKGSVMPTSVKDRFNESGEELYFFVKNKKYYSDLDAVRLPNQVLGVTDFRASGLVRSSELYPNSKYANAENQGKIDGRTENHIKYSKGSEFEKKYGEPWDRFGKNTKKYQGKFAGNENAKKFNSPRARTQRKSLEERLNDTKNKDQKSSRTYNIKKLLSEVRLGVKPNIGMVKYDISERQKELEKKGGLPVNQRVQGFYDTFGGETNEAGKNLPSVWLIGSEPHNFQKELDMDIEHFAIFPEALCEIPIQFGCPKKGIVLDPFIGSGTVAMVAKRLGRNYLGIELSEKYIKLAKLRIRGQAQPLL